jgi:hypothetical protein
MAAQPNKRRTPASHYMPMLDSCHQSIFNGEVHGQGRELKQYTGVLHRKIAQATRAGQ